MPTLGLHNYKTIKCRYFEQGLCKYKDGCHFAHGETELRNQSQTDVATLGAVMLLQHYEHLYQQQEELDQIKQKRTGQEPMQEE